MFINLNESLYKLIIWINTRYINTIIEQLGAKQKVLLRRAIQRINNFPLFKNLAFTMFINLNESLYKLIIWINTRYINTIIVRLQLPIIYNSQ